MTIRRKRIENQLKIFQHQLTRLHEDMEQIREYLGRIAHKLDPPHTHLLPTKPGTKAVSRHTNLPDIHDSNY